MWMAYYITKSADWRYAVTSFSLAVALSEAQEMVCRKLKVMFGVHPANILTRCSSHPHGKIEVWYKIMACMGSYACMPIHVYPVQCSGKRKSNSLKSMHLQIGDE